MRLSTNAAILTLALGLLAPISAALALETSEGETTAHARDTIDALPDSYTEMVGVKLTGGARNRVVVIHASLNLSTDSQSAPMPGIYGMLIRVNGASIPLGTSSELRRYCDTSRSYCLLTWTGWLDLDKAEADNPGKYYDKPIVVSLQASENTGGVGPWARVNASLSVTLEDKLSALSALVDKNGTLDRGTGTKSVQRKSKGRYVVAFKRKINNCTYQASPRSKAGGDVDIRRLSNKSLQITTLTGSGDRADMGFTLHVNCI